MKSKILIGLIMGLTACNSGNTEEKKELKEKETIVTKEEVNEIKKEEKNQNRKENLKNIKKEPKIMFSNSGIILPKLNENKISFRSINVEKVRIKLRQVYFNNTTQFLQDFSFSGNGNIYNYYVQQGLKRVSDVKLDKVFNLNNVNDEWIQTQIDLSNFTHDKGMYIVEISFDEDGTSYKFPKNISYWKKQNYLRENGEISKAFMVTDMGILAQKEKNNEIFVNVLDVTQNKLLKNIKVRAVSYTNQLLEEKKTNKDGSVKFNNADKIFYIMAENNGEMSILKLKDNKLSYDGFNVGGAYNIGSTKAFIYSDRGIYRPGDKINIGIIARHENKEFSNEEPIRIDVFSPIGDKFIDSKVIKSDKNGFFTFNFETLKTSQTGIWQVVAHVGDKKFSLNIPIETIVAHKIEVFEEFPKEIKLTKDMEIKGLLTSKYLFGSPSADLDYRSNLTIYPKIIKFKNYKNFSFSNPTNYMININANTKGKLNEEGKAEIKFKNISNLPKNIALTGEIQTRVIQNSGRPVIKTQNITINPLDTYVGIENSKDGFIKTNDKLNLEIVNLNKDGKQIAGDEIKYRIYRNEYSWWWDYYGYDDFIRSIKNDKNTKLLAEGTFVSKDIPYILDNEIDGSGEIFIEVENMKTHQTAGINVYASSWIDPSNMKVIDRLKIEADKKNYEIDDIAKITFEGAKDTKALVTISSNGKIIKRYWKDINDTKNNIEVKVTKEMFPNAYVNVALFQKYGEDKNDRPLRLYGAVPIMVKSENYKLNIGLESLDIIHPNEKFKVKVINNEDKIINYTMSIVDEGLLNITNFKTPNPYDYFYQKLGLQIDNYDNYSDIIGLTSGKIHRVLTPGGGTFAASNIMKSARLNELGFNKTNRFKPLSIFTGIRTIASNGNDEVEVDIPNYNGQIRVMVVGASNDKYGEAHKKVYVKADVIANLSMPSVLHINDKFLVPVRIFAMDKDLENVKVNFDFMGKTQEKLINIKKGESKKVFFEVNVGAQLGSYKAKLEVESGKTKDMEEIDVVIASTNPYTRINEVKYLKSGEINLNLPKDAISNTVSGDIVISTNPILAIDNRIDEILSSPYPEIEDIISNGISKLYIDNLSTNKNYDKKEIVNQINSLIERLNNYKLQNGGFSYWPNGGKTAFWESIYAGEFLNLAREKGYYIPENLYNSWLSFATSLVRSTEVDNNLKAYAIYVLSNTSEKPISELNYMYNNGFENLKTVSKWYIAGAYKNIGEEDLSITIAKKLDIEPKIIKGENSSFTSTFGDKAIILDLYNKIFNKPCMKLYKEIVFILQGDVYISSQNIGYSMLALGQIKEDANKIPLKAKMIVDNEEIIVNEKNGKYIYKIKDSTKDIKIIGENLFVNEYWQGIPIDYKRKNEFNNMKLTRNFYAQDGTKLDPKKLFVGDTFYMEINANVSDTNEYVYIDNMALTQILPSGWEIENTKLAKWAEDRMKNSNINYVDVRDDRINIFYDLNNYNKNGNRFLIKLNATTKGEFTFPATETFNMENLDYSAYLNGFRVKVE